MAKPIKAPIKGMPMPVGKRPAPPPFPIPHPAQMQAPQAAPQPGAMPGFSGGTDNVNGDVHYSDKQIAGPAYGWTGNASENNSVGLGMTSSEPWAGQSKELAQAIAESREPYARTQVAPGQGYPYAPGRYHSAGVYDPRLMGTFIGHTVGPRAGKAPAMGPLSDMGDYPTAGPAGYAQGTPNVPSPGQTVTNGSWTGPTPQPAPLSPSPLSGQNTGLRARLGLSAGTPRFAEGTSDVGGPNVGAEDGQPAQGYDAQTASYSGLDQHFVAHLRAAIGLAPKPQGFSSGTDDAVNPNDFSARAQQQDAPAPAPVQAPVQAPAPSMFKPMPAPGQPFPPQAPAPDGSVHDVPTIKQLAVAPVRAMAGLPAIDPAQTPHFGDLLQALTGQPQTTTATGKPITDPNLNHAVTQLSGADPSHVDAVLNPHEYTREQFQAAVANMPWGMAKSLWAMQHYLTPQQQSAQQYLRDQGNQQSVLEKALAGSKAGTNEYAKNKQALEDLQKSRTDTGKASLTGAQFPLVNTEGSN